MYSIETNFLLEPGLPVRSMCLVLWIWLRDVLWKFADVTLADEDSNIILTDDAKRAIQGNEAMQVMQTNASGAIWCPNLQLI